MVVGRRVRVRYDSPMRERATKVPLARRRLATPPSSTGPAVNAQSMTSPSADAEPGAHGAGADVEPSSGSPSSGSPSSGTPTSAAGLVAALWHLQPPDAWAVSRPVDAEAGLRATLLRLAETADGIGSGISMVASEAAACATAQLLADTARAVVATVVDQPAPARLPSDTTPVAGTLVAGWALASPDRQRLARLERWLAARAAVDPIAEPAADLCLWVLEHLEGGAG